MKKKNKAISAEEARTLMDGSMSRKGLWFKLKLYYCCGLINREIEKAAEKGEYELKITERHKKFAIQFFPIIAQCYENLGYYVRYDIHDKIYPVISLCWKPEELSGYEKHSEYEYHTKEPDENKKDLNYWG